MRNTDEEIRNKKKANAQEKRNRKKLYKIEKKRQKNIKKHNKKMLRLNEGSIILLSICLIFVGMFIYSVSYILGTQFAFYADNIKSIIDDVAKVLVTISIGSCLLEWFGFVEYIRRRIRDVIIKDDYISSLTKEKKIALKSKLEQDIYYPDSNSDKDSLIYVVQNEIYPLLNDYYYDEYVTHVICLIEGNKLKKRIKRRIVLLKDTSEEIKIPVKSFFSPALKSETKEDAEKCVTLKTMTVARGDCPARDVKDKYKIIWNEVSSPDEYKFSYCLSGDDLTLRDEALIVEIEILTEVDTDDFVYIQRVNRPCRDFTIHFHYDNSKCAIDVNAFGFMTEQHNNKTVYSNLENCFVIRFTDWLLPGDGVCFYINEIN